MPSFADRASALTTSALVGLGLSLASETGMLKTLDDSDVALTSIQVAETTGLKERYTRELLNSLATAELIQVKEGENGEMFYSIDDEAKMALQSPLATAMYLPSVLASIYPQIKECCSKDGYNGINYSDHAHDWFDAHSVRTAPGIVASLDANVPGLKTRLEKGIDVIEFGCGRARLSAVMAEMFPNSHFVASEYPTRLVESNRVRWAHVPNLSISQDDLCALPEVPERRFDFVLCVDVIHDLPDPVRALQGIKCLLREPDGILTCVDLGTSGSPIKDRGNKNVAALHVLGAFLCIPSSYQRKDSVALGPCYSSQTMLDFIQEAGLTATQLTSEIGSSLYLCRLPNP